MIVRALWNGVGTVRTSPVVLASLYLATLILAAPVALGFSSALRAAFDTSAAAAALDSGFDWTTVHDLVRFRGDGLRGSLRIVPWIVPIAVILNTVLSGGILHVASQNGRPASLGLFVDGCVRYAGPFLRLLITILALSVPVALVLAVSAGVLAAAAVGAAEETVILMTAVLFLLLSALCIAAVFLVFDYARVILVEDGRGGSFFSIFGAVSVVVRNLFPVAGLQFCLAGLWGILLGCGLLFEVVRPGGGWILTLAALVVHQLFVCARQAVRVLAFSSQLALYRGLRRLAAGPDFVLLPHARAGSGM